MDPRDRPDDDWSKRISLIVILGFIPRNQGMISREKISLGLGYLVGSAPWVLGTSPRTTEWVSAFPPLNHMKFALNSEPCFEEQCWRFSISLLAGEIPDRGEGGERASAVWARHD